MKKTGNFKNSSRLLLLCIWMLFFLSSTEIVFRVLINPDWRDVSTPRFERHPIYGTFQKPSMTVRRYNPPNYDVKNTTNSRGFRDREDGFQDDLSGIWLAGASNSFGGFLEDDEIYSERLQRMGYENANLASEGHKIEHQVRVIRHLFQQGYRPRAVIFEFTHNNLLGDYRENLNEFSVPFAILAKSEPRGSKGAFQRLKDELRKLLMLTRPTLVEIKTRLINNSAIYTWVKVGINSIPLLYDLTLKWGLREDVALGDSAPINLLRKGQVAESDFLISSTAQYLAGVKKWVQTNLKVPFGVILIPSHHHLNPDRFQRYLDHQSLSSEDYDAKRPYNKSLVKLRSLGIKVLDMAPSMMAENRPLNFPDDGHNNPLGHQLVAEELAKFLNNSLGLSPR